MIEAVEVEKVGLAVDITIGVRRNAIRRVKCSGRYIQHEAICRRVETLLHVDEVFGQCLGRIQPGSGVTWTVGRDVREERRVVVQFSKMQIPIPNRWKARQDNLVCICRHIGTGRMFGELAVPGRPTPHRD